VKKPKGTAMEKVSFTESDQVVEPELETREDAFIRSLRVVDLVCDTATEFIREFMDKEDCPEARALMAQPEILGFRAVEAALRHWLNGGRRHEQSVQ
jgi:hypothetical protein